MVTRFFDPRDDVLVTQARLTLLSQRLPMTSPSRGWAAAVVVAQARIPVFLSDGRRTLSPVGIDIQTLANAGQSFPQAIVGYPVSSAPFSLLAAESSTSLSHMLRTAHPGSPLARLNERLQALGVAVTGFHNEPVVSVLPAGDGESPVLEAAASSEAVLFVPGGNSEGETDRIRAVTPVPFGFAFALASRPDWADYVRETFGMPDSR